MGVVIGWDIGGAHLKAARAENGTITAAAQVASPLRLGLPRLQQAFAEIRPGLGPAARHVVTMTGELADTFVSRQEGVRSLAEAAVQALAPEPVWLYGGAAGLLAPQQAPRAVEAIASANWHASAAWVAQARGTALFMDMGSTTTDIIPVAGGTVAARGYTDAQRLATGELVYTGLVRSFLMASARRAPFEGRWTDLIGENFATMADVHRILASLPEDADQMNTADGRAKSQAASRARLARMVGSDAEPTGERGDARWTALARWFAEAQLRAVTDGAHVVLSQGSLPDDAPVVGAGIGDTVLREAARRLDRAYVSFSDLISSRPDVRRHAAGCAPATALALLDLRPPAMPAQQTVPLS